jgi:hypothetical protein
MRHCSSDIRTCIPFREGRKSALLRGCGAVRLCGAQRRTGHKGNWANLYLFLLRLELTALLRLRQAKGTTLQDRLPGGLIHHVSSLLNEPQRHEPSCLRGTLLTV